jgi:Tol biopolymer transport system component
VRHIPRAALIHRRHARIRLLFTLTISSLAAVVVIAFGHYLSPFISLGDSTVEAKLAVHAAFSFLRFPMVRNSQPRNLLRSPKFSIPSVADYFSSPIPEAGTSKIVFASNREGSMQIYVMNSDGSGVARLTNSAANDDFPRWSPDGGRILFQSDRDNPFSGNYDIYVMNADGGGVARLTNNMNDDSLPSWSPDGTRIVFQSLRNGSKYQVYVMNADGSNQANLSNSSSNDGEPSWSPDGGRIIFTSDRDHDGFKSIYVMNSNGANQQRITFSSGDVQDSQPAWSPDGTRIAFVSTRDSITETWTESDDAEIAEDDGLVVTKSRLNINKEVYVMNADGSGQTRLTVEAANDDSPSWSPDGAKIIFRSDRERENSDPMAQVWTMNPDGTAQVDLSATNNGDYSAGMITEEYSSNAAADGSLNATSGVVVINFDNLPTNTIVTNQYQSATFSSYAGGTVSTAHDCSYLGSCPNGIIATSGFGGSYWPNADLYVNFAMPVNGLTFRIVGSQSGGASGYVDIYANNAYVGTTSFFSGMGFPGQILPPLVVNLSAIQHVTAIRVRFVDNCSTDCIFRYPVYYDDFAFTPELTANITNPRVSGGLDKTNQSSLVGADISLHATTSQSGGTYSWGFTPSSIPITYVSGSQSSQDVTIRPTATGVLTAKLTYRLNGVSVIPTVNINIIIPTLLGFTANESNDHLTRDEHCNNRPDGVWYTLGCYHQAVPGGPVSGPTGIDWLAIAQIPTATYLSNPAQSGVKFVQVVSTYAKRRFRGNTDCFTGRTSEFNVDSGWQLDTKDPYNNTKYFSEGSTLFLEDNDNPSERIEQAVTAEYGYYSTDALARNDQFETYIYYFTTNATNQDPTHPIFQQPLGLPNSNANTPVARLSWSWGGLVVFNYYSVPLWLTYSLTSDTPIGASIATPASATRTITTNVTNLTWRPCGTAVTSNRIDGSMYFVEQLYWDFLQRRADADGENFWRSNITQCVFNEQCISDKRTDVARAFFYSTEFVGLHPDLAGQRGTHDYNSGFVYACYRGFLRREPNAFPDNNWNGFNFWVNKLDSTNPDAGDWKYNEMLKAFLDSIEYRNRFEPLVP